MTMDFARYAGQLRPLTARDAVTVLEVTRQTDEELLRAARKEYAQRQAERFRPRACEVCGDPMHHGEPGTTRDGDDEDGRG
jgi:hypothetical protein